MALTRRTFVKGAAAIPFAIWLEEVGFAQTTNIRFDCTSAKGKAMLGIYADAVKKMMDPAQIRVADPRSWTFQWYTHAVREDRTKTSEISRIYPPTPPPNPDWKALANLMWDTCQSHFVGMNPLNFLPWHRILLINFEMIIRNVSGNASFTLPYWNYTVSGAAHGVIPEEFRLKGNPKFGTLFIEKRTRGNDGHTIGTPAPNDVINLEAFKQCKYEPTGTAILGFCQHIDRNLHGQVHVRTGNNENMGRVPWAAGDPVFWVHHCQIDRLWARWNARGGKNPTDATWKAQTFTFYDGTKKVTAKIGDVLDLTQVKYTYDVLNDPVPDCTLGKPSPNAAPARKLVAKVGVIDLSAAKPMAHLTAPPSPTAQISLGERVKQLGPGRNLFVVISGLKSAIEPGVIYNVYLAGNYIGSIHFFNAFAHGANGTPPDRAFSFDITALAKSLAAKGAMGSTADITFAPEGTPVKDAKPVVGEVSIIEQ